MFGHKVDNDLELKRTFCTEIHISETLMTVETPKNTQKDNRTKVGLVLFGNVSLKSGGDVEHTVHSRRIQSGRCTVRL